MSFMKPYVYETDYLEIDGPHGGEIIPCDVVDYKPEPFNDEINTPNEIADYCENTRVWSIERKHGWVGRYSAPGYMDATSWSAGETKDEVLTTIRDLYETEDEMIEREIKEDIEANADDGGL